MSTALFTNVNSPRGFFSTPEIIAVTGSVASRIRRWIAGRFRSGTENAA